LPRLKRRLAPLERWYVLIVMCLVYALNIAARYVVTTVFEPIRLELKLSDLGAGFLTGVPLPSSTSPVGSPSRGSPTAPIAATSWRAPWSYGPASPCCAECRQSYMQLLLSRIGVGSVRQVVPRPRHRSYLTASRERRPMALSVYALGAPIGAWLGADLAGAVAQVYGWRGAFFALGVPGHPPWASRLPHHSRA